MSIEKIKSHVLNLNDEDLIAFLKNVVKTVECDVVRMSDARGRSLKSALDLYESNAKASVDVINLLAEVDHNCDCAWRAMDAQLAASLMHMNNDVASAASEVNAAIEKYGDPTELEYDDEYTIICKALLTLEASTLADVLKKAKMDDNVVELRKAYDSFNAAQDDGLAGIKFGAFKNARNTAIKAFNKYIDSIALDTDNANNAKIIEIVEKFVG